MERAKWAAKWVGIYVICNLITVVIVYIAAHIIAPGNLTEVQLVQAASRKAVEDYKDNYITKLIHDPGTVACDVDRAGGPDTADVTCSIFDGGKLVQKRTYLYVAEGLSAGSVAGFQDWDIQSEATSLVEQQQ
ncbi:hypothetical protein [Neorhizobium sp. T25_27]|uniref:hypothetical protein n=1 Tax=Neorhizobium sp. T25_27 TaxID=2093831 RepID=UPI000CF90B05|nr:hypothetical protein [Neorhizobium sp. T25_27]